MPLNNVWRMLARPSLVCLSSVLLMSCGHATRPSPKSSSVILQDTSAEAIAKTCGGLAPEVLTPEEAAHVITLNYAARYGKRWQTICPVKKED